VREEKWGKLGLYSLDRDAAQEALLAEVGRHLSFLTQHPAGSLL
jgi:hypothetical protein